MNGLMNMGLLGWILAFVAGFVVGGLFFLSIKLEVEYVMRKRGPEWLMPAALYARIALVGVILAMIGINVPGEKIPAVMLAAVAGSIVARVLVGRMVRKGPSDEERRETER